MYYQYTMLLLYLLCRNSNMYAVLDIWYQRPHFSMLLVIRVHRYNIPQLTTNTQIFGISVHSNSEQLSAYTASKANWLWIVTELHLFCLYSVFLFWEGHRHEWPPVLEDHTFLSWKIFLTQGPVFQCNRPVTNLCGATTNL